MGSAARRPTYLRLKAETLDQAKKLGINVTAVAEEALEKAIAEMNRKRWLQENSGAFDAQAEWHERNGHPLADIIVSPAGATWKS